MLMMLRGREGAHEHGRRMNAGADGSERPARKDDDESVPSMPSGCTLSTPALRAPVLSSSQKGKISE